MTTQQPDRPSLTAEEVAELRDRTRIIVLWGGGNGPHEYLAVRQDDEVFAATLDEYNRDRLDHVKLLAPENRAMTTVGDQRWNTKVWRKYESPEPVSEEHEETPT